MNNKGSGFYIPGVGIRLGSGITEIEWQNARQPVPTDECGFSNASSVIFVFNFCNRPMNARISEYNAGNDNTPQNQIPRHHTTPIDTKFIPKGGCVTFNVNPGWVNLTAKRTYPDSNGHNYGVTYVGESFKRLANKQVELLLDAKGVIEYVVNQISEEGWAKVTNSTGVSVTLRLIQHTVAGVRTAPSPALSGRLDTGGQVLYTVILRDGEEWDMRPPSVRWQIQFLEEEPLKKETKGSYIVSEYEQQISSFVIAGIARNLTASTAVGCFNSRDGGGIDIASAFTGNCIPVLADAVVIN